MKPATLDTYLHTTLIVVSPILAAYYLGGATWAKLAAIPLLVLPATIWALRTAFRAILRNLSKTEG